MSYYSMKNSSKNYFCIQLCCGTIYIKKQKQNLAIKYKYFFLTMLFVHCSLLVTYVKITRIDTGICFTFLMILFDYRRTKS